MSFAKHQSIDNPNQSTETKKSAALSSRDSNIFTVESLSQSAIRKRENAVKGPQHLHPKTKSTPHQKANSSKFSPSCQKLTHPVHKLNTKGAINTLPTILNIFAPAPVPSTLQSNMNNTNTNMNNTNTEPFHNMQTFSNFSAEALASDSSLSLQENVPLVSNDANLQENILIPGTDQPLFTDFSTNALIGQSDQTLSYAIDNLISNNNMNQNQNIWNSGWMPSAMTFPNDPLLPNINNPVMGVSRQRSEHVSTDSSPIKSIDSILETSQSNNQLLPSQSNNQLLPPNLLQQPTLPRWSGHQVQDHCLRLPQQIHNRFPHHQPLPLPWQPLPTVPHQSALHPHHMNINQIQPIANHSSRNLVSRDQLDNSNHNHSSKPGPSFGSYLLVNSGSS